MITRGAHPVTPGEVTCDQVILMGAYFAVGRLYDAVGALDAALCGEAMQEESLRACLLHHRIIYLEPPTAAPNCLLFTSISPISSCIMPDFSENRWIACSAVR